jgi:hypothetical protein
MGALETAVQSLYADDLRVCAHQPPVGELEPWMLCVAHPEAGVLCPLCWIGHLKSAGLRAHFLRPCDACGGPGSNTFRKYVLDAPIHAMSPYGNVRSLPGAVAIEILCERCDDAEPFVERRLGPARPLGEVWPYGA